MSIVQAVPHTYSFDQTRSGFGSVEKRFKAPENSRSNKSTSKATRKTVCSSK